MTDSEQPLYEILDGVRRAKAAYLAGRQMIAARIDSNGKLGAVVEVSVATLLSPKPVIETGGAGYTRWRKVVRATETGIFSSGDPIPPIEIKIGNRGFPVSDVKIEGQDDFR